MSKTEYVPINTLLKYGGGRRHWSFVTCAISRLLAAGTQLHPCRLNACISPSRRCRRQIRQLEDEIGTELLDRTAARCG
ncbi:hypothetical protein ACU4GD_30455 [Cupriavidus basilensis]